MLYTLSGHHYAYAFYMIMSYIIMYCVERYLSQKTFSFSSTPYYSEDNHEWAGWEKRGLKESPGLSLFVFHDTVIMKP